LPSACHFSKRTAGHLTQRRRPYLCPKNEMTCWIPVGRFV
jgi:hypothetical protein